MRVRRARPDEAEQCWLVRNLAIRDGCRNSYKPEILQAWTPDGMPESYREVIRSNPFFVIEGPDSRPVATGFLDLSSGSVEAIFTLPEHAGKGLAGKIIEAIKGEARQRGFTRLTLASTPNAQTFYERHGFSFVQENIYHSRLAQAELRCIDMAIAL